MLRQTTARPGWARQATLPRHECRPSGRQFRSAVTYGASQIHGICHGAQIPQFVSVSTGSTIMLLYLTVALLNNAPQYPVLHT
jgi:hypothetical protein